MMGPGYYGPPHNNGILTILGLTLLGPQSRLGSKPFKF